MGHTAKSSVRRQGWRLIKAWIALSLGAGAAACSGNTAGNDADQMLNASFENTAAEAPPGYKLPNRMLNEKDLVAWAKLVRDYRKPDQFSKDWRGAEIIGRTFVVKLKLSSDYGDSGFGQWSYNADKESLTLSIAESLTPPLFVLSSHVEELDKTKMTNAFGAEREVSQSRMWRIGLGNGSAALIPFQKPAADFDPDLPRYDDLSFVIPMRADAARAFTKDLFIQVEGTVVKAENGDAVACMDDKTSPTIDFPNSIETHDCLMEVQFSRIAFITGAGKIIKEWTPLKTVPKLKAKPTPSPTYSPDEDSVEDAGNESVD